MTHQTPRLPQSQGNIIQQTLMQIRLIWRLFRDPRIHWMLKLIPLSGVAYLLFPFDLIMDMAPILGQLDDAGIILGSLWLFVEMCPADIVQEHMDDLTAVSVKAKWKEEKPQAEPPEQLPEKTGREPETEESE